ncbi:hypothetical protein [Streptomyces sp. NPDC091278]|uniref:hypothetical protein n=1 Tax=Streptomyces sp. NPDC091278 TaxID=3155301 RepID=UPI00344BA58E
MNQLRYGWDLTAGWSCRWRLLVEAGLDISDALLAYSLGDGRGVLRRSVDAINDLPLQGDL